MSTWMRTRVRAAAVVMAAGMIVALGTAQAQDWGRRDGVALKLGFDLPGKLDVRVGGADITDDMKSGISGALEYVWGGRTLGFGAGVLGQTYRAVDDGIMDGKLGFVAGYGLLNLDLPLRGSGFGTYVSGRLGYSFPYANNLFKASLGGDAAALIDLGGGLYWGASFGLVLGNHVLLEAAYNALHGKVIREGEDREFEYRQFTLSVGLQF
jgi:hypothetical protein